jgi:hypothetical protein
VMTAAVMTAAAMTAAARMTAMPMMPAIAAAPTNSARLVRTAPIPARAVPTIVVPTVIMTIPNELDVFGHTQAVYRCTNCCGRAHRDRSGVPAEHHRGRRSKRNCQITYHGLLLGSNPFNRAMIVSTSR